MGFSPTEPIGGVKIDPFALIKSLSHVAEGLEKEIGRGYDRMQELFQDRVKGLEGITIDSPEVKAGLVGAVVGLIIGGGSPVVMAITAVFAAVVWPRLDGDDRKKLLTGMALSAGVAVAASAAIPFFAASPVTAAAGSAVASLYTKVIGPFISSIKGSDTLDWKEDAFRKAVSTLAAGATMGAAGAASPSIPLSILANTVWSYLRGDANAKETGVTMNI